MVSIWACAEGLSLGIVKVDKKSNGIKAIPKLLEMIDIKGGIVTIRNHLLILLWAISKNGFYKNKKVVIDFHCKICL